MSEQVTSSCPLCNSSAKCELHLMRRLKHFRCQNCKEYVNKNKAEQYLLGSTQQSREYFAAYCAKVGTGLVTPLHFEPNGAENAPTVIAEYLPIERALSR